MKRITVRKVLLLAVCLVAVYAVEGMQNIGRLRPAIRQIGRIKSPTRSYHNVSDMFVDGPGVKTVAKKPTAAQLKIDEIRANQGLPRKYSEAVVEAPVIKPNVVTDIVPVIEAPVAVDAAAAPKPLLLTSGEIVLPIKRSLITAENISYPDAERLLNKLPSYATKNSTITSPVKVPKVPGINADAYEAQVVARADAGLEAYIKNARGGEQQEYLKLLQQERARSSSLKKVEVGIDITQLPIKVPKTKFSPETKEALKSSGRSANVSDSVVLAMAEHALRGGGKGEGAVALNKLKKLADEGNAFAKECLDCIENGKPLPRAGKSGIGSNSSNYDAQAEDFYRKEAEREFAERAAYEERVKVANKKPEEILSSLNNIKENIAAEKFIEKGKIIEDALPGYSNCKALLAQLREIGSYQNACVESVRDRIMLGSYKWVSKMDLFKSALPYLNNMLSIQSLADVLLHQVRKELVHLKMVYEAVSEKNADLLKRFNRLTEYKLLLEKKSNDGSFLHANIQGYTLDTIGNELKVVEQNMRDAREQYAITSQAYHELLGGDTKALLKQAELAERRKIFLIPPSVALATGTGATVYYALNDASKTETSSNSDQTTPSEQLQGSVLPSEQDVLDGSTPVSAEPQAAQPEEQVTPVQEAYAKAVDAQSLYENAQDALDQAKERGVSTEEYDQLRSQALSAKGNAEKEAFALYQLMSVDLPLKEVDQHWFDERKQETENAQKQADTYEKSWLRSINKGLYKATGKDVSDVTSSKPIRYVQDKYTKAKNYLMQNPGSIKGYNDRTIRGDMSSMSERIKALPSTFTNWLSGWSLWGKKGAPTPVTP